MSRHTLTMTEAHVRLWLGPDAAKDPVEFLRRRHSPIPPELASPIEVKLYAAIHVSHLIGGRLHHDPDLVHFRELPRRFPIGPTTGPDDWYLARQMSVGTYRADFVIGAVGYDVVIPRLADGSLDHDSAVEYRVALPPLVVECDGHDFHDRTKEQAQRDRERDRAMNSMGYRVCRFTGSEIWRDPWKCVEQIHAFIHGIQEEVNAAAETQRDAVHEQANLAAVWAPKGR